VTDETKLKLLAASSELHDALHQEMAKSEPDVLSLLRLQAAASSHILVVLMALVDNLPTEPGQPADGHDEDPRQRRLF
jgi:hypothetical protein